MNNMHKKYIFYPVYKAKCAQTKLYLIYTCFLETGTGKIICANFSLFNKSGYLLNEENFM